MNKQPGSLHDRKVLAAAARLRPASDIAAQVRDRQLSSSLGRPEPSESGRRTGRRPRLDELDGSW